MDHGRLRPHEARDAEEFVAMMRELKEQSGCTYRELADRAVEHGDVLARSTLSDVLRRTDLPRPEILVAFLRACRAESRMQEWLSARDRIEAQEGGGRSRARTARFAALRSRLRTHRLTVCACVTVLSMAAVWAALFGGWADSPADRGSGPVPGGKVPHADTSATPEGGRTRPRLAGPEALCLAVGRPAGDRTSKSRTPGDRMTGGRPGARSRAPVTVVRSCDRDPATARLVYLEPGADRLYHLKSPRAGRGAACLTAVERGALKGRLAPAASCGRDQPFQLFGLEPFGESALGGYRLRVFANALCVGLDGGRPAAGAAVRQEPCSGAADQRFLLDPVRGGPVRGSEQAPGR